MPYVNDLRTRTQASQRTNSGACHPRICVLVPTVQRRRSTPKDKRPGWQALFSERMHATTPRFGREGCYDASRAEQAIVVEGESSMNASDFAIGRRRRAIPRWGALCACLVATLILSGCKAKCRPGQLLRNGLCTTARDSGADANDESPVAADGGDSTTNPITEAKAQAMRTPDAGSTRDSSLDTPTNEKAGRDGGMPDEMMESRSKAPTCGNGIREGAELCDGSDCVTECGGDNACITAQLKGAAETCDARCESSEVSTCESGDGCCPSGCDHGTDSDCSPSCGDGVLTGNETCEPGSQEHLCPTAVDCDDGDPCTDDMVTGSAEQCSAKCAHAALTRIPITCDDGDPCTDDTLVESRTECSYECRFSSPRQRSGSCEDSNPCTDDTPVMSADRCEYMCPHSPAPVGTDCGGGRSCMNGRCEAPPARCGDGVQQGTEECDDGSATWECDRNCRERNFYVACATGSDCADAQSCVSGACVSECGFVDGQLVSCPGGVLPEPALEIGCYVVQEGRGYCRPSCTEDGQCPYRMRCVAPATSDSYGTCFPG